MIKATPQRRALTTTITPAVLPTWLFISYVSARIRPGPSRGGEASRVTGEESTTTTPVPIIVLMLWSIFGSSCPQAIWQGGVPFAEKPGIHKVIHPSWIAWAGDRGFSLNSLRLVKPPRSVHCGRCLPPVDRASLSRPPGIDIDGDRALGALE